MLRIWRSMISEAFRAGGGRLGSMPKFRPAQRLRLGVSQNCVILCKFPQKYLFCPGGGPPLEAISDGGAFPAWRSPIGIVRHSGLIICKVEGFILKRRSAKSASV